MNDGTIRVGTKIDFSGVKADIKAFEKELATIQKETDKLNAREKQVRDDYNEKREFDSQFPAEMSHRDMIDKEADEKLDPIIQEREILNEKAREYTALLEQAKGKLQEQLLIEQAGKELSQSSKAEGMLSKIQTQEQYNSLLEKTKAQMAVIEAQAERIAAKHGLSKEQLLATNTEYVKLADTLAIISGRQDEFGQRAKDSFNTGKTSAKSFDTAIKGTIKRIARMGLGLLGARSAFMALRRAASTYMDANEDLKNQVQGLWNVLAVAIGPVVEKLVSWLTIAISYVNAFVKALWGVDLVAKANALALNKQAKATSAAAKASKQLVGFDEMNKLSDTSGGASSSSAGTFKPVDVNADALNDFIEGLKTILPYVTAIATGIAAWKIAKLFGANLKDCAGWALLIAGAVMTIWGFVDAIVNGLDWENLLTMIIGIGVAVGGLAILFGTTGVAIGLIVGGLMLVIAGFKDWLENGKSLEALTAITVGILAIGGALAILVGWPALIVAAIAAMVVALVMYWDEILAWNARNREWLYENVIKPIGKFFVDLWNGIKDGAIKAWNWICDIFSKLGAWFNENVIKPVAKFFVDLWTSIKDSASRCWGNIKSTFSSVGTWFKDVFTKAWTNIKNVFSKVGSFFSGIWDTIKSKFTTIGSAIGDAIGGAFKTVVNSIIGFAEKTINGFIKAINSAIGLINKIPGVNITKLTELSIPRLAKGGIVNNPGRGVPAIIGEAGAEAVLPLENNTEWMDMLAEKIGGNVTIPIYMDGKKIATYVVDIQKKKAFAMNGA